jgi:transcriptional regulator with XRE-family HTH domain
MRKPGNEFGRELRRLRREGEVKYSQARLAELAGVTASYLSQLETGKRNPTPRVIRRLSPHLGVSPNHLLRTIGMLEMDLASTLASKREYVDGIIPDLAEEQLEELANYLTYLEFKEEALRGALRPTDGS